MLGPSLFFLLLFCFLLPFDCLQQKKKTNKSTNTHTHTKVQNNTDIFFVILFFHFVNVFLASQATKANKTAKHTIKYKTEIQTAINVLSDSWIWLIRMCQLQMCIVWFIQEQPGVSYLNIIFRVLSLAVTFFFGWILVLLTLFHAIQDVRIDLILIFGIDAVLLCLCIVHVLCFILLFFCACCVFFFICFFVYFFVQVLSVFKLHRAKRTKVKTSKTNSITNPRNKTKIHRI